MKKNIFNKGERSIAWKGGRCKTWNGYIKIYQPNHPYADSRGYIREHRLVVEKSLGRYLLPTEDIHHKNGIKIDNRIENLIILSRSKHLSLETKGINNPFYGKKHSPETILKLKEARKKQISPMLGKHHSEETKRKISETKRRLYEQNFAV